MKQAVGKKGEDVIGAHIESMGWKILGRNYHSRFGEVDIIARDKDEIVFIEVKMRTNELYGQPVEAVTKQKLQKLTKTAQWYLLSKRWEKYPYRIDVFSVFDDNGTIRIEHFSHVS